MSTIDALFGSKTRVKLLHLFLNNPDKAFYVREITRLIDEQINSVRRELANMLAVGVILSDGVDNKLYYTANQQYEHYESLRQIFAGTSKRNRTPGAKEADVAWKPELSKLSGLRVAIVAGILVRGSASPIDLLLVGSVSSARVNSLVKKIEKAEGRELNYTVLSYDDFYYRLSVRDKFIAEILNGASSVLVDTEQILSKQEGV